MAGSLLGDVLSGAAISELVSSLRSFLSKQEKAPDLQAEQLKYLKQIANHFANDAACNTLLERNMVLTAAREITLDRQGRPHNMIFTPAAITLLITVPGMTTYSQVLASGWTLLDLPDGTRYQLPPATADTPILYRADDVAIGRSL